MALFRSERSIGRGEVAESRIEMPFIAMFMMACAVVLLAAHLYFANQTVTIALAVSFVVFGTTVVRVEFGVYVLVIAMLLSPEISAGHEYSGERPLNIRYDDLLIPVVFVGVLVKLAFEGRATLWLPSPINKGIAAYWLVCIVSTLLAVRANLPAWDRRTAFFVFLKMTEFYMVFVLVGNAVRTRNDVRRQLTLFFVVAAIVCVYGIYTMGDEARVSAPFEHGGAEPNTLGGYLTMVIALTCGLLVHARDSRKKLLFAAFIAVALIPFFYTLSRASYGALFAALATLGISARKPVVLGLVAVVLLLSPVLIPGEVRERIAYTFQESGGEPLTIAGRDTGLHVDKSTNERIYVWRKVWFILHVAPWFGGGISWETVMDSQFARVILETGLFGLVAFVFLLAQLLRTAAQTHRWSRDWLGAGIGLGMSAATVGLIVHAFG
ncbi:MAG TPA: hypothetical protein ENN80_04030, partial [Candidatus Hydrogenedentes bacterium]|nr:hypothetical protein [Candidatus Hydrogenedentota bacterium]